MTASPLTSFIPVRKDRLVMQSCQHALPQGKFAAHNMAEVTG